MTEKRYYAHKHLLQENQVHDTICPKFMNLDETVEHMNNQYWKYKQLKEENEQLKSENIELTVDNKELKCTNNELYQENEQLKQRNENQYQQLNKLWGLIQAKDWETLTAMDKKMKEDEERLQREWKCYE